MDDDEILTGRAGNEALQNYEPMSRDPRQPEPEPDPETHGSDRDSMIKAANELHASRSPERDVVPREYRIIGGEHDGEPSAPNQTLDIDRAASDLAEARRQEVQAIEDSENEKLAAALDSAKGVATEAEIQEWVTQQAAWIAEQKANQQQAVTDNPPPPPDGVDRELYDLLMRNPRAAQALQAEVNQVAAAQKQYANAAEQNARLLAASLVADVPELQNLDSSQYGLALDIVARANPQRADAIRQRFGKIQELYQTSQQARAQQAQVQTQAEQHRFQQFARQQEQIFESSLKSENPETVKQVKSEILNIIEKDYGVSKEDFARAFRSNSVMQHAAMQRMMFDAAEYKIAQRTATANPARAPVPPVFKPGVASYRTADDGEVAALRSEFLKSPDAKSAARFIAARRRAS